MINVLTLPQHQDLLDVAQRELPKLRSLTRPINSKDIEGYQVVANELWAVQFFKCCYCEFKISKSYNDVEHYRPKGRANRKPGCVTTHGYWWLAFSLNNLLFACPSCNRSAKNDKFPLAVGSAALMAEQLAPGGESPLFIDPAGSVNPVEHIKFIPLPFGFNSSTEKFSESDVSAQIWLAVPRSGSKHGKSTIEVADLNRMDLVELRSDYVRLTVWPLAKELMAALTEGLFWKIEDRKDRAEKLIRRGLPFTALAFDALNLLVPAEELAKFGLAWPIVNDVGKI
jgi:hypothetical protein